MVGGQQKPTETHTLQPIARDACIDTKPVDGVRIWQSAYAFHHEADCTSIFVMPEYCQVFIDPAPTALCNPYNPPQPP